MTSKRSIKKYLFKRVTFITLCLALILAYHGTQSFLKGIDIIRQLQMTKIAKQSPQGFIGGQSVFEYYVASSWEFVPDKIKAIFSEPQQPRQLQKRYENWWYFAPPERIYIIMMAHNEFDEPRYISFIQDAKNVAPNPIKFTLNDPMIKMSFVTLLAMLVFMFVLYGIFKRVATPITRFYKWAQQLNLDSIKSEKPSFSFEELDQLAAIMYSSFTDMGKALDRENAFLSYASHELRTPLAALRSDVLLLDKVNPTPSDKERLVRARLLRSSLSMKGITETLLWLSREDEEPLEHMPVQVDLLVMQLNDELNYLLTGKTIEVILDTTPCIKHLPEAAFMIIVANIIRNAFQHTTNGTIFIRQTDTKIQVTNPIPETRSRLQAGFGLGLRLIRKLASRFDWQLLEEQTKDSNIVIIRF
jgi:signal transduction histidine kinase